MWLHIHAIKTSKCKIQKKLFQIHTFFINFIGFYVSFEKIDKLKNVNSKFFFTN